METLKTKRTYLRRFKAEDLEQVCEIESDPLVMKLTGPARAQSKDESKRRLDKIIGHQAQSELDGYFAVIEPASEKLIAWFMLIPISEYSYEIGFMVNRAYWGKGYAFEVCHFLCQNALKKDHIKKIVAHVSTQNGASQAILKKCLFTMTKTDESLLHYCLEETCLTL